MKKHLPLILLGLFVVLFTLLSYLSATRESLTYDEIVDLQEGRNALLHHTFDIDPYNPPLTREIGVLPYILNKQFYTNPNYIYAHPLPGRVVMIFLGAMLLVGVFLFTKNLLGVYPALLATFLLSIEPTVLANSHYLTMDIGLTLFLFMAYTLFLQIDKKSELKKYMSLGVITGLGMATKITFIPYFFLSSIIVAMYQYMTTKFILPYKKVGLFFVISLLTIWACYFFNWHVVIKERQDSSRVSERILTYAKSHHNELLKHIVLFGKNQPIPLGDYIATIKNNAIRSTQSGHCFFLGSYYAKCQWYFMATTFLFKIPLPLFILFLVGFAYGIFDKKYRRQMLVMLIPIISIFLVSSSLTPLVRYILPAYPFIAIVASLSWNYWRRSILKFIVLLCILTWYLLSVFTHYPHFISFANELAGPKDLLYTKLEDSNLDWGQSLPDVATFHQNYPNLQIQFSYFGRDNGDFYNLKSNKVYTGHTLEDICAFHSIAGHSLKQQTIISVSNWYECGYYKQDKYAKSKIKGMFSDSFLLF